jgi:hypothetical protein
MAPMYTIKSAVAQHWYRGCFSTLCSRVLTLEANITSDFKKSREITEIMKKKSRVPGF